MKGQLPDYVVIGVIEKARGIKGQVKVRPLTDYPPRFKLLRSVLIELHEGEYECLEIQSRSVTDSSVYLTFKGITTREAAQSLAGAYVNIKREKALPLEDGAFYHFEVVGYDVTTDGGRRLGHVAEVMDLPANAVLVVKNETREFLIPVIKTVIVRIDRNAEAIIIKPMDGLLD